MSAAELMPLGTLLTMISATPARHKTAIRTSRLPVGCSQLLLEPPAILLNGFHGNLQLLRNFRSRFAVAKQP